MYLRLQVPQSLSQPVHAILPKVLAVDVQKNQVYLYSICLRTMGAAILATALRNFSIQNHTSIIPNTTKCTMVSVLKVRSQRARDIP